MRVEVSGRLESVRSDLSQQLKHKFRKLKFPTNPLNARYATTLINFDGHDKFKTRLDGLVQGLELAMEHENMSPPVEVPNNQPVTYQQVTPEAAGSSSTIPSHHTGLFPPQMQPLMDQRPVPGEIEDSTAPTMQNLASLSSRWLMSPPITINTTSESQRSREQINTSSNAPNTSLNHPNTHEGQTNPVGEHMAGLNASTVDVVDRERENPREAASIIQPNEVQQQISNGQVEFETVAFFMRIWVTQAIMNFLSAWGVSQNR
ncbi:hypothetical protein F5B20DRAFT_558839 [Whalleya microplaca]|nr:hypothetical protein F5B20DRAFT_558839 [Whalleya microplaca]